MKLRVIGFKEESGIVDIVDGIAKKRGVSRSDVVREALREKLQKAEASC
jgi:metal-responsive CopG/Arc/MetJ family transcriptional regulator